MCPRRITLVTGTEALMHTLVARRIINLTMKPVRILDKNTDHVVTEFMPISPYMAFPNHGYCSQGDIYAELRHCAPVNEQIVSPDKKTIPIVRYTEVPGYCTNREVPTPKPECGIFYLLPRTMFLAMMLWHPKRTGFGGDCLIAADPVFEKGNLVGYRALAN